MCHKHIIDLACLFDRDLLAVLAGLRGPCIHQISVNCLQVDSIAARPAASAASPAWPRQSCLALLRLRLTLSPSLLDPFISDAPPTTTTDDRQLSFTAVPHYPLLLLLSPLLPPA